MSINGLLKNEMPREKLINYGANNLTDVELLAIILRTGTKNKNVIELSREIIEYFNVSLISRKTYEELLKFKGISNVKAVQIVALFELSRRLSFSTQAKKIKLCNSKTVYEYIIVDFNSLSYEKVLVIFVDSKNQVIKKEFIFEGTINYSIIEPRKIIKRALVLDASGFFIIHNHPSGDVTPSQDDINVTKKIKEVCENLNLRFLDHLIYGDNDFFSFYDNDIF